MQCHVCEGTKFVEDHGYYYCTQCHTRQLGTIATIVEDEFGEEEGERAFAPVYKAIASEAAPRNWMSYEESMQYILRCQVEILIQNHGFPIELVQVVESLWFHYFASSKISYHRITTHALKEKKRPYSKSIYKTESSSSMNSEEGMQIDDENLEHVPIAPVLKEAKSKAHIGKSNFKSNVRESFILKQPVTVYGDDIEPSRKKQRGSRLTGLKRSRKTLTLNIEIIYLASLYLRVPILPCELCKLVREGNLPFFSASKLLPKGVFDKKWFEPNAAPTASSLFTGTRHLYLQYQLERPVPPINCGALLSRMISYLQLSPFIHNATERLTSMVGIVGDGVIFEEGSASLSSSKNPYVQILAHIVVVLKCLYRLDDEKSAPSFILKANPLIAPPTLTEFVQQMLKSNNFLTRVEIPWTVEELQKLQSSDQFNNFIDYCKDHLFQATSSSYMELIDLISKGPVQVDLDALFRRSAPQENVSNSLASSTSYDDGTSILVDHEQDDLQQVQENGSDISSDMEHYLSHFDDEIIVAEEKNTRRMKRTRKSEMERQDKPGSSMVDLEVEADSDDDAGDFINLSSVFFPNCKTPASLVSQKPFKYLTYKHHTDEVHPLYEFVVSTIASIFEISFPTLHLAILNVERRIFMNRESKEKFTSATRVYDLQY